MHPAYSVILFTTASGAGYGLLIWLGILAASGWLPADRLFALASMAIALALVTVGLLASTFHLGHPERAWRAFSQWRSSWLSREGVAAVFTYVPAGLFAIGWIFFGKLDGLWSIAGLAAALGAIATVYCTGMIYASLRTIRQWNNPLVPAIYMALSLATGSICLNAILYLFGENSIEMVWLTLFCLLISFTLKSVYWVQIDTSTEHYTAEQATGLGKLGKVKPLEPPHTQPNYVMREMGFKVARKHANKLRLITFFLAFIVPICALLISIIAANQLIGLICALVALLTAAIGTIMERWLFFAEAEHIVMLYYGAKTA